MQKPWTILASAVSRIVLCMIGLSHGSIFGEEASPVTAQIATILNTGPQGVGSKEARHAADRLAAHGVEILPDLLRAMDTTNVVAANWLRTVADPLVEQALSDPDTPWPREFLKDYVSDAQRQTRPREWALGLLDRLDPKFRTPWMVTRLDDPAFRYEAVAGVLLAGETALSANQQEHARAEFLKAFRHARDAGQVTQAATQLKSLGVPADVRAYLGLITQWRLIGPFDAPRKTGYAQVFPPEQQLDFSAKYIGQTDAQLQWISHETKDLLGTVNLNEALTTCREAVGYAYAEIVVAQPGSAELRCGADDNCTVWLNGEKVFGRDQWLNGTRFDRFITPVTLRAGRNSVLVKVCQGPQHRDPEVSNNWTLQLRFCAADGLGIPFEMVPSTTDASATSPPSSPKR